MVRAPPPPQPPHLQPRLDFLAEGAAERCDNRHLGGGCGSCHALQQEVDEGVLRVRAVPYTDCGDASRAIQQGAQLHGSTSSIPVCLHAEFRGALPSLHLNCTCEAPLAAAAAAAAAEPAAGT